MNPHREAAPPTEAYGTPTTVRVGRARASQHPISDGSLWTAQRRTRDARLPLGAARSPDVAETCETISGLSRRPAPES